MENLAIIAPANCVIDYGANHLCTTDIDKKSKGYYMTGITGYGTKKPLFAAVWGTKKTNDYTFTTDMSPAEFQKVFNNLSKNGYSLHWVDGYNVDDQVKYAAIWKKSDPKDYIFRHGLASIQFYTICKDYQKDGYRPIHVASYNNKGYPCYAGIWVKDDGPECNIRHNFTSHEFEQQNKKFTLQGYTLKDLNGCCYNGEPSYTAIWERNSKKAIKYDLALHSADFKDMCQNMEKLGYYPLKISGFDANNTNYFAVLWQEMDSKDELKFKNGNY